ncbi:hypothetical protein C7212DRAFT_311748 [Tuber magnatum]|uniref:Uncharacterized protein n=1 Tax=Tuber magnatum TaxID=42249 RepID=A0A317T1F7_9PEZI|nr:hypothetical protein C7212DRAFT_311748 [Tuber magnatum]
MEDPRATAWQDRLDYHSRLSAVRVAFKASYAQAIPTVGREQYYRRKLPELTEWVVRRCALERPTSNDEGDESSTHEAIGIEGQEQVVAPGPEEHAPEYGQDEPVSLSDDGENIPVIQEKPPSTKEVSEAKPLTVPEAQIPATKSTALPKRNKRLRTEIERLLDTNWGGNSIAIIGSLNQNGTGNPSRDFLSANLTGGEIDLGPAAKRTRSARNSLQGSARSSNSTQNSVENPPAKTTKPTSRKSLPASLQPPPLSDKPYEPNSNATPSEAQNMASIHTAKPSRPTANAQQKQKPPRTSKPKSRSKPPTTASKNPDTQTYLTTDHSAIPFQIKAIFNRYPALYRLPRRQRRPDSPKLDIHSLIYRCRRAARNALAVPRKKGEGGSEGKCEARENGVVGGEGIVFLSRNAVRGRSVWGGK